MARLKKSVLLEKLKELDITFDENMKYNDLHKLYDNNKDVKPLKEEPIVEVVKEPLNAVYTYKPEKDEKLIVDKPTEPVYIKTDKQIYDYFTNSGKVFNISYKGSVIFNSKEHVTTKLKTHNTHYEIHGLIYPYVGSSIKFNS